MASYDDAFTVMFNLLNIPFFLIALINLSLAAEVLLSFQINSVHLRRKSETTKSLVEVRS